MAEASASGASRFNASDDEAFQALLSANALPAGNVLENVRPSDLNFTANCWTTFDLLQVAYNNSAPEETSRLLYIKNDLLPALPQNYTSIGLIESSEYWNAISQLNSTKAVVNASVEQCKTTKIPTPAFDFTANCSATGDFWWHNVYNLTIPNSYALDSSWPALFKSSLLPPLRDMSDYTILTMCETVRNRDLKYSNDFPYPLQTSLEIAAATCALPACRSLDYHGNSDIVGAGSVVAYGFIAGVSTLLAATAQYFRLAKSTDTHTFRNTVKESAVNFWDTIIWFALLACAAGYTYSSVTLYEYVASILVNNLLLNSAVVLVVMYYVEVENISEWTRVLPQYCVYFLGASVNWKAYFRSQRSPHFAMDFTDMPCYADTRWPIDYLMVALRLEIAILAMIMSWFVIQTTVLLRNIKKKKLGQKTKNLSWFWKRYMIVLVTLATVAIWLDFGYIVLIRNRARYGFGSSYQDDAIGYGQVIAAGIAAQAIYAYLCAIATYLWHRSEKRDARKDAEKKDTKSKSEKTTGTKKDAQVTVTVQEDRHDGHHDIESEAAAGPKNVAPDSGIHGESDPMMPNSTLHTRYTL